MKVVISGGGTGGHIYPALALIHCWKAHDPTTEFLYIGTEQGLESRIVPEYDIPFETIHIQGFRRSLSLENFKTVYLFLKSVRDAKKRLRTFAPDVVIGTGGYVSGAVLYAAAKLGIPTVIHEQNSVPGITNKFLARYVSKVCLSFSAAEAYFPEEKTVLTGNPRAQEVSSLTKRIDMSAFHLKENCPTALLFGGSRGALRINEAFLAALPELAKKSYQVLYISGNYYYPSLCEKVEQLDILADNISIQAYIDHMEAVLPNVQVVVSRAGATTLAEITALGLPSVLIPSPNVTNDHQTKNAQSLVERGAAIMITDQELTGASLLKALDSLLLNEAYRQELAENAKAAGIPDAADRLYAVARGLISK